MPPPAHTHVVYRPGLAATIFVGLAFVTGTTLTCWGLVHMAWPQALPWLGKSALLRYALFLVICTALVVCGSLWSKRSALFVGAIVATGLTLLSGALWPLLVALWFAVASTLLGRSILVGLRIGLEGDSLLTSFLVGAGVYGTIVGLFAHFPVSYPGMYGVALALPVILSWRVVAEEGKSLLAQATQKNSVRFNPNRLDVAIAVVAMVHFAVALMPELGHDALATHLFIPAHLATRHQWGFDVATYVWAVMPMLGDWIFSIGYILAGETAARLINVGFIFILCRLARDLVLWAGGTEIGARWAALIFLSTPLTFAESSTLFIESVWASFVVASMLAVLGSRSVLSNQKYYLPVTGLFLGCALAAKAVTLTILPIPLLLLIARHKLWRNGIGLSSLGLGFGLLLVIGLVPYVTAWWRTGNPVFPFFNAVFRSPYFPASNFDASVSLFGKGLTWDILYRGTFESGKYLEASAGASGFQWLLLFLPAMFALLANRQRKGITLLLVGVFIIAAVFCFVSYFRYAFPAWAVLSAVIGLALSAPLSRWAFINNWGHTVAAVAVVLNLLFLNAGAQYRDFPLKSIGNKSNHEQYLLDRLPIRNAVELVNRLNANQTPVAVFSSPLVAGLSADALFPNWYNHVFQGEIMSLRSEQDVENALLKRNVDFVILDSNWQDGAEKQYLINKITDKIMDYGSISVRKIKLEHRFKTELLTNPELTNASGWTFTDDEKYDAVLGVALASRAFNAYQVVSVSSGHRYLNTIVTRCTIAGTLGHLQINWIDAKGKFIKASIKTFGCSPTWTEHAMEVTAPLNAVHAMVFMAGHSPNPIEFKVNSLRQ